MGLVEYVWGICTGDSHRYQFMLFWIRLTPPCPFLHTSLMPTKVSRALVIYLLMGTYKESGGHFEPPLYFLMSTVVSTWVFCHRHSSRSNIWNICLWLCFKHLERLIEFCLPLCLIHLIYRCSIFVKSFIKWNLLYRLIPDII